MTGEEGSAFGRYQLIKRIASGGMGEIHLGKLKGPLGFEKLLVIKRILEQHVENAEFFDMFLGEARLTAQLSHANIVQIFEMGEVAGSHYIAMEYVHGKSLHQVLRRTRARGEYLHPSHVVEIMSGVCHGMGYAHHAKNMSGEAIGVIHRDLNPYNVLVSYAGEAKVIDFGIARSAVSLHKTQTGAVKGKLVYMSPEQSAAEPIDHRSDIFSIGICAYEAFSLENPFSKDSLVLSLDAVQHREPAPLAQTSAKLAPFDPVVSKALAKAPSDRYAECTDLGQALEAALHEGGFSTPPQNLAGYMHDLFEEEIDQEQRAILGTDSSGSSKIEMMQQGLEREQQPGSNPMYRLRTPEPTIRRPNLPIPDDSRPPARPTMPAETTQSVAQDPTAVSAVSGVRGSSSTPSRWPLILGLLLVMTLVSFFAVLLVDRGPSTTTVVEIAPPAVETTPKQRTAILVQNEDEPSNRTADEEHRTIPQSDPPVDDEGVASRVGHPGSKRRPRAFATSSRRERSTRRHVGNEGAGAAAPARFGNMRISTLPPVTLSYDNAAVGQTFELKATTGDLVVGSGRDPQSDPFVVHIHYTIRNGAIEYSVNSKPWAIVKDGSGIALGKTPLPTRGGSPRATFELVNPRDKLTQRITLQYRHR
jgi:serine/threonine-protein kinase